MARQRRPRRLLTKREAEARAYVKIQAALTQYYGRDGVCDRDVIRLLSMILLSRKGVLPAIQLNG